MKIILLTIALLLAGCNDIGKIQQTEDKTKIKIECTDSSGQKIVHVKVVGAYFNDGSIVSKLVDMKTMLAPTNCIISNLSEAIHENE